MEEDEILEIEVELKDGTVHNLKVKEVDSYDWDQIPKEKMALLQLVNNKTMLVVIQSADIDGVSFKLIGDTQTLYYDEEIIASLFVEI